MRRLLIHTLVAVGTAGAVTATVAAVGAPAIAAPAAVVAQDGRTQPTFSYRDAIREKVFVTAPSDSDGDGKRDRVALYITRPKPTDSGLKVASIVQPSPYYWSRDLPNQVNWHPVDVIDQPELAPWQPPTGPRKLRESWVYHDNYFVPRGYAVIKVSTLGTGESTGCVTTLGRNEQLAMKAVVDWLNDRATGHAENGDQVAADWSTGNVAMAGKSYEGTLPLGAAATGVPGLKTVVSIMGVSHWYDQYRRNGGVISAPGDFAGEDADIHSKVVLSRADPEKCAPSIRRMERDMDRVTGDYNAFWHERNFLDDAERFPPTFLVAGLRDTSVRFGQFAKLWQPLGRHDVPRKAWIVQAGHDDPLHIAEQRWLDAVHGWFDHWLYGIDNGVGAQARQDRGTVDFETAPGQWRTESGWPHRDARAATLALAPGRATPQPGQLRAAPAEGEDRQAMAAGEDPQSLTDAPERDTDDLLGDPDVADRNRLLYLTEPLPRSLRLSGTPTVTLRASVNGPSPYLSAILVDLGRQERITGFTPTEDTWCFGPDGPGWANGTPDSGCRPRWAYQTGVSDHYVVSRGWMDVRNRHSDWVSSPVDPDRAYDFSWELEPSDHVFEAGRRIALMVTATDHHYTLRYPAGTQVSVQLEGSSLQLPIRTIQHAEGSP